MVGSLVALTALAGLAGGWKRCDVTEYGAKGDNITLDTPAIVAAVAACAGGGEIRLPAPGTFLTGAFNLTDNQVLYVEDGAMLVASQSLCDFSVQPSFPSYGFSRDSAGVFNSTCRYSAVVGGVGVKNISITGGGTLDGSGWHFWALEAQMQALITECQKNWTSSCRVPPLKCSRPHLVEFEHSSEISMTNLTLMNSPFWTSHFIYSSNIFVKDVAVYAPFTQGNTDGVNPDSSSNVHIENLYVANGDDGVAIKSGLNEAGIQYNRPTVNVTIRNMSTPVGYRGGIAIGSEMSGGVRQVRIENVALHGQRGVHIKTTKGRGGFIEDVTIVNYTGNAVQLWDHYNGGNSSGPWPYIANFTLRNVKAGCSLNCGKMPPERCLSKSFDIGPHSCGHSGASVHEHDPSEEVVVLCKCVHTRTTTQSWHLSRPGTGKATVIYQHYNRTSMPRCLTYTNRTLITTECSPLSARLAQRFSFGGAVLPDVRWLGKTDECLKAELMKGSGKLTFGICDGSSGEFFLYADDDQHPNEIANPDTGLCLTSGGNCLTDFD